MFVVGIVCFAVRDGTKINNPMEQCDQKEPYGILEGEG